MTETKNPEPEYAHPKEWTNYGDVSPEEHGGVFVRWVGGEWSVVRTVKWADVCADADPDDERQHVDMLTVEPDDVFVSGDPENGLTGRMKDILDSLGDQNHALDQYDGEPADYAPEFMERIGYYVADFVYHYSGRSELEDGEYDEILDKYGVDWDG